MTTTSAPPTPPRRRGPKSSDNDMGFTEHQLQALRVTERVCSCLSIIGAFIIITTFLGSVRFRKPINRLVFYASWGNIMSNVATLISLDGIDAGVNHPLCRFQAFLIQWYVSYLSSTTRKRRKKKKLIIVLLSQVHYRRSLLDSCHGDQCIFYILPQV